MLRSNWLSSVRGLLTQGRFSNRRSRPRGTRSRSVYASEILSIEPRVLLSAVIPTVAPEDAKLEVPPDAVNELFAARPSVSAQVNNNATWTPVGPTPIQGGQTEGLNAQNNPVSGGVHVVLADPTDVNTVWIGTTNGGIWKTTNASASAPTWTPLTDQENSLSIGAMAFDTADATNKTVVAGIGRYSSLGNDGGARIGLLRTTDGGATWASITGTGAVSLVGKNISGISVDGQNIVVSVNVADNFTYGNIGIFRSTDGGTTFTQVSGANGSGLPQGVCYDLVTDPLNKDVLFSSVVFASGGPNGVYRSTNGGASWTKVGSAAMDGLFAGGTTNNVEFAVGRSNNVFAGILNNGQLAGLFMSQNGGTTWVQLDSPSTNENGTDVGLNPVEDDEDFGDTPEEIAGGQGSIHFSIAADPAIATLVYVGGDRQPNPFPNSLGANNFSGRLFRVNGALATGSQATALTHNPSTTNKSSPHADSRDMTIDAAGNILEGDDGGIYRRTNPQATGDWFSVHGNLQNTEFHSIAYDSVSNIYFGGAQDVGTPVQNSAGSPAWSDLIQGDGGVVAVDDVSLAAQNQSIRYVSFQGFGFFSRVVVDANNQILSFTQPTLTVTQTGTSLSAADANIQFYQPYVLNAIDPSRGIIGTRNIYESANRFDTLDRLFVGSSTITAMAYGGTGNADAIYYGDSSGKLFVRPTAGGSFTQLSNYQGGTPRDIILDPSDWQTLIVVDSAGVYRSTDAGASWTNVTGNLAASNPGNIRSVTYIEGTDDDGILIGADRGVFLTELATIGMWDNFGPDLPNAPVRDLRYDATDDVLVAGVMGRGAWVVNNAHLEVGLDNNLPVIADQTFAVNENASPTTVVGTVVASDPDAGQTLTYAITAGNTGNAFSINASTGQLTVQTSAPLNLQTNPVFTLTVQVTDNGLPARSSSATITVNVLEVNVAPVVPPQTFSIPENRPAGSVVGTVTATDTNVGQTLAFSITGGNIGGAFAINATTGELTVANATAVNFEVTPTFTLTVQALDNGLPPLSGSGTITINLSNVNDPPKVPPQTFSVIENAAVNTVVGTVTSTDEDSGQTRTYAITNGNIGNAFQINSTTGAITVKTMAAIDFETTPVFSLTVTATDNGNPVAVGSGTITVSVININDPPTQVSFINATTNLAENVAKLNRVKVADIVVTDDGLGTNQLSLSGADNATFEIIGTALFVKAGTDLNFEVKKSYTVNVNVDDTSVGSTPDASATFALNIIDVNEAPLFPPKTVTLPENSPVGTFVAGNYATDPDVGQTLSYAITAGNRNSAFAINPSTGAITVNNPAALDWENEPPYELKIAVTDNGSPALITSGILKVVLTNVNDAPLVYRAYKTIPENLPNGSVVLDYKIVASDQDAGQTLKYAITGGNDGNAFAIDPNTGIITVNNSQELDYENQPPFELKISVTDNGIPALTSIGSLRVALSDMNDAPRLYNGAVTIPENSPVGATVLDYTIVAKDQDVGQTLSYAILSGNRDNAFAIDPNTGLITVKNSVPLDFETAAPFDLVIAVTDTGTPALTSQAHLLVKLSNVNDAPQFTNASVVIFENLPTGTTVFDLKTVAKDADAGQSLSYAITGGNRNNAFKVNPQTGIVTVDNSLALDWENAPPFALEISVTDSANPAKTTVGSLRVYLKDANDAPHLYDASKTIPENLPAGALVLDYTIVARDQDAGQILKYAITGGNTANAFAIDSNTGLITVSNAAAIDFETNPTFELLIKVTDNGSPVMSSTAKLTIKLTDLKEPASVLTATFTLPENSPNAIVVGTVSASAPPDPGQTRSFSITGGNVNNAFAINATTGQITVNNSAALNFEGTPTFSLTVTVTDTGAVTTTGSGLIKVNLTNVNEAPVILAQTLAVKVQSPAGTVVGTVAATDPDAGQTRTFAIVSGNGLLNNVFAIDPATGKITVSNALGVLSAREFNLGIRVTDNGSPALSTVGNVRIVVNASGVATLQSPSASTKLVKKTR